MQCSSNLLFMREYFIWDLLSDSDSVCLVSGVIPIFQSLHCDLVGKSLSSFRHNFLN